MSLLAACGPGNSGNGNNGGGTPTPTPVSEVSVNLPTSPIVVTNLQKARLEYSFTRNNFNGTFWYNIVVSPSIPYTWHEQDTPKWIEFDTTGKALGDYTVTFKVREAEAADSRVIGTGKAIIRVIQDPSLTTITQPEVQILQPGQQVTVPLTYAPPANGTPAYLSLSNPAPQLLDAKLTADGKSVQVSARSGVLSQGPIPIDIKITAGSNVSTLRLPIFIGTRQQKEFDRYNAVRAQAGLNPVALDKEMSMNCWMHGVYRAAGNDTDHTENSALPGYSDAGRNCAENSNLSEDWFDSANDETPRSTNGLFAAPFHALGMLKRNQTVVGIGIYTQQVSNNGYQGYRTFGGIYRDGSFSGDPVFFPGNGKTTDFSKYGGSESPDPLASCPGFDPKQTGLPLIYISNQKGDTTVTNATLTLNGQNLEVCAYGSTQYVNNSGRTMLYADGPKLQQDVGREGLQRAGAVVVIPKQPLKPGSTYTVKMSVNGQPVQWSFNTAASLVSTSVNSGGSGQ